ncbi:hypothetical protein TKK_0011660 [Trichogramma kaykai]
MSDLTTITTPGGNGVSPQSAPGSYQVQALVAGGSPLDSGGGGGGKDHLNVSTNHLMDTANDDVTVQRNLLKDALMRSRSNSNASQKSTKRVREDPDDEREEVDLLRKVKMRLDETRKTFMDWWILGDTKVKLNKNDYARLEESYRMTWDLLWDLAIENKYLLSRIGDLEAEKARISVEQRARATLYSERVKAGTPNKKKASDGKMTPNKKALNKKPPPGKTVNNNKKSRKTFTAIAKGKPGENMELKSKVFNKLDPVNSNIHVEAVRTRRDGTLVIEACSRSDLEKVLGAAAELDKEGIELKERTKRSPRDIVYDIPNDYTENYVLDAISKQNKELWGDDELSAGALTLSFKPGGARDGCTNWVFEVTPAVRLKLMDQGKLYIGMSRCKVEDFVRITRCYKCQEIGHISRYCKEEGDTCAFCAEPHSSKTCTSKDTIRCALCKRQGKSDDHKLGPGCPLYKQALKAYTNTIDYG